MTVVNASSLRLMESPAGEQAKPSRKLLLVGDPAPRIARIRLIECERRRLTACASTSPTRMKR